LKETKKQNLASPTTPSSSSNPNTTMELKGALWLMMLPLVVVVVIATNTNSVYQPCADSKIQRSDGFTFGIAFSSRDSFFFNQSLQLSPCDHRLSLSSSNSQLALFRPKVDEISLLTINTSSFFPVSSSVTSLLVFSPSGLIL